MNVLKAFRYPAAVLVLLLTAAGAEAAYKVYLRNGSVIENVLGYERTGGQIILEVTGGQIGFPAGEIFKIEETAGRGDFRGPSIAPAEPPKPEPPKTPMLPEQKQRSERINNITRELASINEELSRIEQDEAGYKAVVDELNQVRLRIENLYRIGREKAMGSIRQREAAKQAEIDEAIKKGESTAGLPRPIPEPYLFPESRQDYLSYLTPEERQMVQINMLKKRELEKQVSGMERQIMPLIAQKERLLAEKKELEEELRDLRTETIF